MGSQIIRQPIEQLLVSYPLLVNTVPTPLNAALDINAYVQSFTIGNPSVNTASVFWGDGQVTASTAGNIGSGIEILAGTAQHFIVEQIRQLYELQEPENLSAQKLVCQPLEPVAIPVIVWNPQNFFLISTVATTVSVVIFRNVYI